MTVLEIDKPKYLKWRDKSKQVAKINNKDIWEVLSNHQKKLDAMIMKIKQQSNTNTKTVVSKTGNIYLYPADRYKHKRA